MLHPIVPTDRPPEIPDVHTLVDLVIEQARAHGTVTAYRFLETGDLDGPVTEWSYAELDRRARAIAVDLLERAAPGDRALLVYPPGLDFIAGFLGCLYAGVVAVPAYPPEPARLAQTLPRLSHIATDCEPRLVLTTSAVAALAPLVADLAPALAELPWLATDEVGPERASDWSRPAIDADTLAFLQYTSGSTGNPRGVEVRHGNIMHNEAQILAGVKLPAGTVVCGWLPTFHDMGLIGHVLHPIWLGSTSVLMSPVSFLQKPLRWLHAITRYRAGYGGGPNFGYELCARKATAEDLARLDLSCWHLALSGAERVRAETIERFTQVFGPVGFRREAFFPAYGLAEATLYATGNHHERAALECDRRTLEAGRLAPAADGKAIHLVSCGKPELGLELAIVDPASGTRRASGEVGEIWLSGANVSRGYFRRTEESAAVFGARLAGSDAPWLRTGDLGSLVDGALYVTGRMKDLVILRGRNHFPDDLERTVEACDARLRPGCTAAFALLDKEGAAEERLVVAAEVDAGAGDLAALARRIRARLATDHDVHAWGVVLAPSRSLPKTSSGKIRRSSCREQLVAGTLETLHIDFTRKTDGARAIPLGPGADRAELSRWLLRRLAAELSLPPETVREDTPFAELGLDSLQATELAAALETALGRPVPATELWNHPSVAALSNWLLGASPAEAPRRAKGARPASLDDLLDEIEALPDGDARTRTGT